MTLVLVVDDDQDLAEMLGIVLTGAGIDVDLVSRGDEALEVFRNNPPDLVLLDVMLPGLDGIEVCRQIRAESMVPIVMLSAKGDSHDVVRGLEALAREPGRVFSRDALLSEVWGYRHSTDTRLVNVHVQRLRSKIEHDPERPEIVLTVRGVGYKAGHQSS
ncbi:MAG: DNA-binding response regulator [Actinobacteria bacterium]|nr:DNA-binding response regulator [Actinomycetota bacterium]